jgi:putative ABC transport system permease protein
MAIGLVLGLVAGILASRLAVSLLFGLSPYDPFTILGVVLLIGVTAGLAAYLPSRRAARMDPTIALRYD